MAGWRQDLELKNWLEFQRLPYVVVATKVDKLNQKEQHRSLTSISKELSDGELFPFSAVTGRGAREIWQAISKTKNIAAVIPEEKAPEKAADKPAEKAASREAQEPPTDRRTLPKALGRTPDDAPRSRRPTSADIRRSKARR